MPNPVHLSSRPAAAAAVMMTSWRQQWRHGVNMRWRALKSRDP